MTPEVRRARGPGRVNLIGDHTDYNRGLALPMAIELGVSVEFLPSADSHIAVTSAAFGPTVRLPVDLGDDGTTIAALEPPWARLIGAMIATARPDTGGTMTIDADLPI